MRHRLWNSWPVFRLCVPGITARATSASPGLSGILPCKTGIGTPVWPSGGDAAGQGFTAGSGTGRRLPQHRLPSAHTILRASFGFSHRILTTAPQGGPLVIVPVTEGGLGCCGWCCCYCCCFGVAVPGVALGVDSVPLLSGSWQPVACGHSIRRWCQAPGGAAAWLWE